MNQLSMAPLSSVMQLADESFSEGPAGMSKRGGNGIATVTKGLCDAYKSKIIEGLKTNRPEQDKRLQNMAT